MNKMHKIKRILIYGILIIIIVFIAISVSKRSQVEPVTIESDNHNVISEVAHYDKGIPQGSQNVVRQNTVKNTNGYSWYEDTLLYSTDRGIFHAGSNRSVVSKEIDYISFNTNGQAIYLSNNRWYLYSQETTNETPITVQGNNPLINKDASIAASINNSKVVLEEIQDKMMIEITPKGESVEKFAWAYNSNDIVIVSSGNTYLYVQVFNTKGTLKNEAQLQQGTRFLDINPTADSFVYTENGYFTLYDFVEDTTKSIKFDDSYSFSGNWITNNEFILISTNTNSNDRTTDFVWKIDKDGSKKLLVSTVMIPNKLNTSVYLSMNQSLNILPLVEKENSLWIMSLVADGIPQYTDNSPVVYPNERTHERSAP